MPRRDRSFGLGLLKAAGVALLVATPLAGVWVASSLAAFANQATWLPVAAGLALFPGLPLAWEALATHRHARSKRSKKPRWLTFSDRLVLRTLAINLTFFVVLLALFPSRAFIALSTRGDWMLDGRRGELAVEGRRLLLKGAGALEWLYRATSDDSFRRDRDPTSDVDPTPTPGPSPTDQPPTPFVVDAGDIAAVAGGHSARSPELHPLVRAMPREAEASIESVGGYIAAHESNPMLRVKAIHDWVADRVAYDARNYAADRVPDEDRDAQAVFRTRVGVCAGYAKLLTALGKITGDEIVYVVGDARSQDEPMTGVAHAWNAAKIDGAWYLIDATWDAGTVDGSEFTKQYRSDYLFTPPEQFVVSHFPDEPRWQLARAPLSRAEFFRRPVLAPVFFEQGLTLRSPDRSQVTVTTSLELVLDNPRGAFLLASFEPRSGGPRSDCTGNGHTQMSCLFPGPGTYDVRLYAHAAEHGSYPYAGSVQVNVRP